MICSAIVRKEFFHIIFGYHLAHIVAIMRFENILYLNGESFNRLQNLILGHFHFEFFGWIFLGLYYIAY